MKAYQCEHFSLSLCNCFPVQIFQFSRVTHIIALTNVLLLTFTYRLNTGATSFI